MHSVNQTHPGKVQQSALTPFGFGHHAAGLHFFWLSTVPGYNCQLIARVCTETSDSLAQTCEFTRRPPAIASDLAVLYDVHEAFGGIGTFWRAKWQRHAWLSDRIDPRSMNRSKYVYTTQWEYTAGPDLAGGGPGTQPNYGAVGDLEMKDGGATRESGDGSPPARFRGRAPVGVKPPEADDILWK